MNTIVLYGLAQDEKEKPELIEINKYKVFDDLYDEENGIHIMSKYIHLNKLENEQLYVMGVNAKREIAGVINIAVGNYEKVEVYKRNVILFLALTGSKAFADYHNHPNNSVRASEDDIISEAQMDNIAKLLEIHYLGSYILGRTKYIRVGETTSKLIEEE